MKKDELINILPNQTNSQIKTQSTEEKKEEVKQEENQKKLDPTHFGDWQVNCRTIDF
jgi:hypothetical protein